MSLNEKTKDKPAPDPVMGGVSRSRSFAGLSHRRTASASAAFTTCSTDGSSVSSGTSSNSSSLSHGSTIGQSYSPGTARHLIQGLSATWSGKPPKAPRPERAQIIFDAISKGLRDSITFTQNDISNLRAAIDSVSISSTHDVELCALSSILYEDPSPGGHYSEHRVSQGRLYELEKQMKSAERYLKKLEFQLSKIEELREQYEVQQRMRDGIRTMAYAYVLSPGKERGSALHSVRSGFKECTDLLCSIESKLERMMGTLLFEMKGIQGFARICSGDVFEVVIKHGEQKWKSRGRVFKNQKQCWENQRMLFKSLFSEPLYIKASEIRGLGKNVLLGNKYCETRDLFSAHPQQMTINLNPSGSLKLNLIITWNPLHGAIDDTSNKIPPSLAALASPHNRHRYMPPAIPEASDFMEASLNSKEELPHKYLSSPDDLGQGFSSGSTSASTSAQSSAIASPDVDVITACSIPLHVQADDKLSDHFGPVVPKTASSQLRHTDASNIRHGDSCNLHRWSAAPSGDSSECCSIDMGSSSAHSHLDGSSLRDVLQSLLSSLEDIQGQYPDLQELHEQIFEVDRLLKKTFHRRDSSGSNISISVESALGCFDFLNSAIDSDAESTDERSLEDKAPKTSDSGIASMTHHLLEDGERLSPSSDPSPQPLSTGLEHLDITLATHIQYCLKLIEQLGSFGPLKCLEVFSLDKLRKQSSCFAVLLKVMNRKHDKNVSIDMFFLDEENELKELWGKLTGCDDIICLTGEQILPEMERLIQSVINEGDVHLISKVSYQLICQIMDSCRVDNETVCTVLQFGLFFSNCNCSAVSFIKEMGEEVRIVEDLQSKDISRIMGAMSAVRKIIPTTNSVFVIGHLLTERDLSYASVAEDYLKAAADDPSVKEKIITMYLEGLESENALTRQGSCIALGILQAFNCAEQLAYVSYADENSDVREDAKLALFRFESGKTNRKKPEGPPSSEETKRNSVDKTAKDNAEGVTNINGYCKFVESRNIINTGEVGRKLYEESQLFTHGFQGLNVK